jgi:H/ACA ribonucleoprotein complex subunit 3
MKALIRVCHSDEHDDGFYTLCDTCPDCGAETYNTAPPRFSPDDPYGEQRRRVKWMK